MNTFLCEGKHREYSQLFKLGLRGLVWVNPELDQV